MLTHLERVSCVAASTCISYLPSILVCYYAENEAYGHTTQCTNTHVISFGFPGFLFGSGYRLPMAFRPALHRTWNGRSRAFEEIVIGFCRRPSPRVDDKHGSFIDFTMWRDADIQVRVRGTCILYAEVARVSVIGPLLSGTAWR
jgi:hypothetical protein